MLRGSFYLPNKKPEVENVFSWGGFGDLLLKKTDRRNIITSSYGRQIEKIWNKLRRAIIFVDRQVV